MGRWRRLARVLLMGLLFACVIGGAVVADAADPAAGGGVEASLPPLTARVNDLTGTLDAAQRGQLEAALQAIEQRKGAQVAILLLPTTQPESIEAYGMRLAEAWKLGRKGVDDGLIIIVARNDRRMRIEVGYGLEGVIPDAVAKRIIAEDMAPRFRQNDYAGGLQAAVGHIAALVDGESLPPPAAADSPAGWEDYIGFALVGMFVAGAFLRALLGRLPGALVCSGLAFAGGWFVLGSLIAGAVFAAIAFFVTLAGGFGRGVGGGFGGGGGFSSGGFSGGGGGFGGGGASGNW